MKKYMPVLSVFLFALLFSPFCFARAERAADPLEAVSRGTAFVFPPSLVVVEEEAFEGTAVQVIVFQDGLLQIGENAFLNAEKLTDVYIPRSARHIADNAFSGTTGLTVHGVRGSYAGRWAKKHGVRFVVDDIWHRALPGGGTPVSHGIIGRRITTVNPVKRVTVHARGEDEGVSMRPQERPELNPIDYRFP